MSLQQRARPHGGEVAGGFLIYGTPSKDWEAGELVLWVPAAPPQF